MNLNATFIAQCGSVPRPRWFHDEIRVASADECTRRTRQENC